MIKGILFDFDGTLVETNSLFFKAMSKAFEELFGGYTKEQLLECIGPPLLESGRRLYPEDPEHFANTYRKYQREYHDNMIHLYPGVKEMLDRLKGEGYKLAIVTSKRRDMFEKGLAAVGLEGYFEATVADGDGTRHKPDAQPLESAMQQLELPADVCMMVGDNTHDINGAKAAGIPSVLVSWAVKGVDEVKKTSEPDFILEEAMDLFGIIDELNERKSG